MSNFNLITFHFSKQMLMKEISPLEGSVKLFEIIVLCFIMQTTGCLITDLHLEYFNSDFKVLFIYP